MSEFFTWEFLATYGGMVAFVTLAVQIVKKYISIDPKWIALAAAVLGQIGVQTLYLQDYSANGIVMAVINVFAVLLGAVGAYETVIKTAANAIAKGSDKDA